MSANGERVQKILARASSLSRRQAEALIAEGRVTVNGRAATLGDRADPERDAIKVDGKRWSVQPVPHRYVVAHKPRGTVSTREDPQGRPTVMDILPPRLRGVLMPVGRLDFETEGLLLLTNDGALAQRVSHPRHGCAKTYEVKVKGRPERAAIERLRGGIRLYGKRTAPVKIEPRSRPAGPRESQSNSWWTVVLREGRTRQIREMFFRIGHPVARLRRVAIGPLTLSGLPPGAWRELSELELERLRAAVDPKAVAKPKPKARAKPKPPAKPKAKPKTKAKAKPKARAKPGSKAAPGAPKRRSGRPARGRR